MRKSNSPAKKLAVTLRYLVTGKSLRSLSFAFPINKKHICIRRPGNLVSLFYNYKDFFSIILLAMVDSNYKLIAVEVGSFGKEEDSGITLKSNMGQQVLNGSFAFPEPCKRPGSDKSLM
ncbi:uncharacterized protein LOC112681804 [Sipha flava]|uniref:Uncharacterized protein LOC112681804 n=1 Tax=Sipha flava TaxID=143950 RepID=A0A8B8FAL7_9HEMI|nr:uncharacterized protein LOC112681804 [Sipha flava]